MEILPVIRRLSTPVTRVVPVLFILPLVAIQARAQQLDTATALGALRDAAAVCHADAGALWQHDLCGPIALADRQTRMAIANDTVARRHYVRLGDAFVTV